MNCEQVALTGTVIPFSITSTVSIGASSDNSGTYGHIKMQVLDLRFYSGSCMTDNDINDIVDNTNCQGVCSGCWGPGNYSCSDFLTMVDPHEELTLDS